MSPPTPLIHDLKFDLFGGKQVEFIIESYTTIQTAASLCVECVVWWSVVYSASVATHCT